MAYDWDVRLTNAAEADFSSIIDWTADRFGEEKAETYAGVVAAAIEALSSDHAHPKYLLRESFKRNKSVTYLS